MPVERSDLSYETQQVFRLYDYLKSEWDTMNGIYMGKDLTLFPYFCEELDFQPYLKKYALSLIPYIDNIVASEINRKMKQKRKGFEEKNGR